MKRVSIHTEPRMVPHAESTLNRQVEGSNFKSMQTERLFYADAIRAFAIIAIVFLHVSSPITQDFSGYHLSWWWIANVIYSCARPAIALFVMISGLLLLAPEKEENIGTFFKKRFVRIAIPFLFWGMVYFFWKTRMNGPEFTVRHAIKEFIQGPVYYHLWFIYTIAGIYLATPVFRVYAKNASRSNQLYLLVLWFIGTSLYPMIKHYTGISIGIPVMVAGGFLGAFLLGNFLRDVSVGKRGVLLLCLIFCVCVVFTASSTYVLSLHSNKTYNGLYEDFLSPNVIVMAICVFLVFKSISFDRVKNAAPLFFNATIWVSSASFSVYLMHILVLEIFKSHVPWFSLSATTLHPLIGIPLTAGATLLFCTGTVMIFRKIPYMKFVLP
jgi:surface polysaccharide O-acyltransferase-like enzyme